MNVALCFYGQPRYLENLNSVQSHKEHIYSQAAVDVYTHFWFSESQESYPVSDWCRVRDLKVHKNTVEAIKVLYNPIALAYEQQKEFTPSDEIKEILKPKPYYTENNVFNLLSHLYSLQKCIELFEERKNKSYDFVIVSRFDNKIHKFPNLTQLSKNKFYLTDFYGKGFNDYIYITDEKYLSGLKVYENFDSISKLTIGCVPEEYKQINFHRTHGKDILEYIPNLQAGILRSSHDTIGQI